MFGKLSIGLQGMSSNILTRHKPWPFQCRLGNSPTARWTQQGPRNGGFIRMENIAEASFQQFDISMMPAHIPIIFRVCNVGCTLSVRLTT